MAPMLEIKEGQDYSIDDEAELPYTHIRNIGFGNSGNVEEIQDIHTGAFFVRKTIRISSAGKEAQRKIFENEFKTIRRLRAHHHIIRVFATYVARRQVGIILHPVARDGDLEYFLENFREDAQPAEANISTLKRAIGCLAGGLAFMHQQKIRHKDIKPRNILVHEGRVIYTDFGYSLDSSQRDRSTTSGNPSFHTRRYSAPEVLEYEPRNSKSDIFSLGCVYLEILSALTGSFEVDHTRIFSTQMSELHEKLKDQQFEAALAFLVEICSATTAQNPQDRPTAYEVCSTVQQYPEHLCHQCKIAFSGSAPEWIWGEQQQAYYYVTYDPETGEPIYHWHQNQSNKLNPGADEHHSTLEIGNPPQNTVSVDDVSSSLLSAPPSLDKYRSRQQLSEEELDPSFRRREGPDGREFFRRGRVFAMLWNPTAPESSVSGKKSASGSDNVSVVADRFGEPVVSKIRRFVIVSLKESYINACAISTYSGRGTMFAGCVASEHAIIYLTGSSPLWFEGESKNGMVKDTIEVAPVDNIVTLQAASRIRFSKTYIIERDEKMKEIGQVIPEHMERLIAYWRDEQKGL